MYIRQTPLFFFEKIIKFQRETKLELILSQIDILKLTSVLRKPGNSKDSKDYEPEQLIYSLIAMQIEKIQSIKDLVLKLRENQVLKYCYSFDVLCRFHLNILLIDFWINSLIYKNLNNYFTI